MKQLFFGTVLTISLIACGGESSKMNFTDNEVNVQPKDKQLNISILLDMSDRINPEINPDAKKNDIENIKSITEFFTSNMEELGAYKAKGKIRIFFNPPPSNSNINSVVSKLIIDCSKMDNKGRKKVYDSLTSLYSKNLEDVYSETIATSAWEGCDIWSFMKDDVKDFCIDKDSVYRNILIILTDGYLYHKQSVFNFNNRFTYLLSNSNMKPYRNKNWQQLIEKNDFGLKTEREDLKNLEVLVLEVKAENPNNKLDEDILQFVLSKWLGEMNVSNYKVYKSDLPANTKSRIESFLNQK